MRHHEQRRFRICTYQYAATFAHSIQSLDSRSTQFQGPHSLQSTRTADYSLTHRSRLVLSSRLHPNHEDPLPPDLPVKSFELKLSFEPKGISQVLGR